MSKNGKQQSSKNGRARFDFLPPFVWNTRFQQWTIAVLMSLAMAVILSPQIHLITPSFKLGAISVKDIKADRDYLVQDKASTELKRLEAAATAKPVYDYDNSMPSAIGMTLAKAFLAMGETYQRIHRENLAPKEVAKTREQGRRKFESIVGFPLSDIEFAVLDALQFPMELCNRQVKVIYSIYNRGPLGDQGVSTSTREAPIIVRDIKTQEETVMDDLSSVLSVDQAVSLATKNVSEFLSGEEKSVRRVSLSLVKKLIKPNLTFAQNATEKRKKEIMDHVKPVFYKVQKNEMIVREGEKITAAQIDKLSALSSGSNGTRFLSVSVFMGMFLTIMLFAFVLFYIFNSFLASKHRQATTTDIMLLAIAAVLQIMLVRISIFLSESINSAFPMIPIDACMFAIPFAAAAMLVVILINRNVGLVFSVFISFLTGFLFEDNISMVFFALIGSMVSAFRITECKQRSAFFRTGLIVGCVNMAVIVCLMLLSGTFFTIDTITKLVMGFAGGILSAAVISSVLPLFESLFGYTTDIRLLELANLNQPIFQEMIMVAPGTYHHSAVVASMVEAAAESIGAHSLLSKVSAFYHDIGKMKQPLYFIENQRGQENKLDKLSPKMSSLVIISHVKKGCELAREYKLGDVITDIIRQHHGTRLVGYFYDKAQKDKDPSVRAIPEGEFRYPGPKPQTKEAGLILLGDVIEASSRVLKNPTPSRIKNLVDDRINQVLLEGELDECELTFFDLSKIAESFTRTLNGIFHQRIDYPQPTGKESNGRKEKNANSHRKQAEKYRDIALRAAEGDRQPVTPRW
jgi:hypothetical protein